MYASLHSLSENKNNEIIFQAQKFDIPFPQSGSVTFLAFTRQHLVTILLKPAKLDVKRLYLHWYPIYLTFIRIYEVVTQSRIFILQISKNL